MQTSRTLRKLKRFSKIRERPALKRAIFLHKAERNNAHTLLQPIELFHFFVQKRIHVFGVNKRCVEIAVAEEFTRCRERNANSNARCGKGMAC